MQTATREVPSRTTLRLATLAGLAPPCTGSHIQSAIRNPKSAIFPWLRRRLSGCNLA